MISFTDSEEMAVFRTEVRTFIEANLPNELKGSTGRANAPEPGDTALSRWDSALRTKGWHAAYWPREYGGAGLSVGQQFVLNQELALSRAPSLFSISTSHAGPTIMHYGTEQQKDFFLPRILSGEHVWCQGFSEPGAGSDLASLQTRAVRDGDEFIVNGQKIWTSGGHRANWMILLVRTDPEAPKHKGISYFLLDMASPGVTVRPLINMAGRHEFNEVFFDNVRLPAGNLIGELNRGWYVATTTLDLERSNSAGVAQQREHVLDLCRYASQHQLGADRPWLRHALADRRIEVEVVQMLSIGVISDQIQGRTNTRGSSVLRLFYSQLQQRIASTAMNMLGMSGQLTGGAYAELEGMIPASYLGEVARTIAGGSAEIQRNVIAQRGLGLPR